MQLNKHQKGQGPASSHWGILSLSLTSGDANGVETVISMVRVLTKTGFQELTLKRCPRFKYCNGEAESTTFCLCFLVFFCFLPVTPPGPMGEEGKRPGVSAPSPVHWPKTFHSRIRGRHILCGNCRITPSLCASPEHPSPSPAR